MPMNAPILGRGPEWFVLTTLLILLVSSRTKIASLIIKTVAVAMVALSYSGAKELVEH